MSNKDLTVLKVKDFSSKEFALDNELHPNLPRHPFLMLLSSAPRSGKTVTLLNLIASSNYYNIRDKDDNPYFDEVFWCSPSAEHDPQVKGVLSKMDNVHVMSDPKDLGNLHGLLSTVIADQTKLLKEKEPLKRICFLIDDGVGFITEDLGKICTRYRHFGLTIIVSIQKYTKAPLLLRTCIGHFITFKQNNGRERERITDELGEAFMPPKQFEEIMETVTEKKYQFLYLNMEKLCMYRNFDTLLYDAS